MIFCGKEFFKKEKTFLSTPPFDFLKSTPDSCPLSVAISFCVHLLKSYASKFLPVEIFFFFFCKDLLLGDFYTSLPDPSSLRRFFEYVPTAQQLFHKNSSFICPLICRLEPYLQIYFVYLSLSTDLGNYSWFYHPNK